MMIQGSMMEIDKLDSLELAKKGIYEVFETELIKKLIKKDDICIDVGAHIGYYTLLMSKLCKRVYAFEPEYNNNKLLHKNLKLNKVQNVTTYTTAAGEHTGMTQLHICDTNTGMHRVYPSKWCNKAIPVRILKIDEYVKIANFIKIDAEGSELGVLKGMKRLIERCYPKILMEFHPPSILESGTDPRDVYNFLAERDYLISLLPDVDNCLQYEDLMEATTDDDGGKNVLCGVPE